MKLTIEQAKDICSRPSDLNENFWLSDLYCDYFGITFCWNCTDSVKEAKEKILNHIKLIENGKVEN